MINSAQRISLSILLGLAVFSVLSDDIELYDYAVKTDFESDSKVLIIFDNSGSMAKNTQVGRSEYDPNITYSAFDSAHAFQDRAIYYNAVGVDFTANIPDSPSDSRRFPSQVNACHTSHTALREKGFYLGNLAEYKYKKNKPGSWEEIPDNNGLNVELIDCKQDLANKDAINTNDGVNIANNLDVGNYNWQEINTTDWNGLPNNGFPTNNKTSPYSADISTAPSIFNTTRPIMLYTANYLRWYNGGCDISSPTCTSDKPNTVTKTRLEWAKLAINNTVESTPGLDVGLMVFNFNAYSENRADGGRVILAVDDYTGTDTFTTKVNNLDGKTNTPLCETMYEAYRYLAGLSVKYGNDDAGIWGYNSRGRYGYLRPNIPPRDFAAEKNGVYKTPFDKCIDNLTVILVTDGEPTLDNGANDEVRALVDNDSITKHGKISSYLPNLTKHLAKETTDILPNESEYPGNQNITTYVIGMGEINSDADAVNMLKDAATGTTASNSDGYYSVNNVSLELQTALLDIFYATLNTQASYTSPSVATNNFDRTRNLNNIYYSMFLPRDDKPWWGNLKKFKVEGDERIVDKNGKDAISSDDGNIADASHSFWSVTQDGDDVDKGGVLEHLRNQQPDKRTIYAGNGPELVTLDSFVTDNKVFVLSSLGLSESTSDTELALYKSWIKGKDVDDVDSESEVRPHVLGDILHSKPLVLNYGDKGIRIIVGTNSGFLHMFEDQGDTVKENWAYLPNEFWPLQKELRNYNGRRSYYGIDSSPVAYRTSGETWVFFGLRRGGSSYYGMNLTNPDAPSDVWKIDHHIPGFENLGQTWSVPLVTEVPGVDGPVLIFSGGYDINKDADGVGGDDSLGRGVYMVKAKTGELIWSVAPYIGSSKVYDGFKDSMPGGVAGLDSDKDGKTDRLYVTDTGANVFRIDMPGSDKSQWSVHRLASLGGDTDAADRRFFYEPAVAQTLVNIKTTNTTVDVDGTETKVVSNQTIPFDAILIGSGNRANPLGEVTDDSFFMLQDRNIQTATLTDSDVELIEFGDLYDITAQPINADLTKEEYTTQLLAYGEERGWYHSFNKLGEKSLSSPVVIDGVVYFTSYIPSQSKSGANACIPEGGGRIYAVGLQYGTNAYHWKYLDTGTNVPDTPQLFAGEDNVKIICGGCEAFDENDAEVCIEEGCKQDNVIVNPSLLNTPLELVPNRVYYYQKEENQ